MKPYFAKYLPVEGEIKMGDKFRWIINDSVQGEVHTCTTEGERPEKYKKVKLFLCSRDIQVGDKPIYMPSGQYHTVSGITELMLPEVKELGLFKIIGEISTEATWAKEGDGFDESQVEYWTSSIDNHANPFLKIKGPCGHFH